MDILRKDKFIGTPEGYRFTEKKLEINGIKLKGDTREFLDWILIIRGTKAKIKVFVRGENEKSKLYLGTDWFNFKEYKKEKFKNSWIYRLWKKVKS